MLTPVPGISTPLNLEINLLYCPPEHTLPISISLPLLFVVLKFRLVSIQKPSYYANPLTIVKFVLTNPE